MVSLHTHKSFEHAGNSIDDNKNVSPKYTLRSNTEDRFSYNISSNSYFVT